MKDNGKNENNRRKKSRKDNISTSHPVRFSLPLYTKGSISLILEREGSLRLLCHGEGTAVFIVREQSASGR
jgi:hypothetical protein